MNSKQILTVILAASLCALPFAVVADDALAVDTSGNTYNVALREGQAYSYTPTFSISGVTVSISGTAVSAFGMTVSGSTISGTAPTVSTSGGSQTYSLDITASTTRPTQTAHQYINFTVYDTLTISGGASVNAYIGKSVTHDIGSNFEGKGATYSATNLPGGLSINSSTGKITGTVSGSTGNKTATITVQHTASGQTTAAGAAKTLNVTFAVSPAITGTGSDGGLNMYVINGTAVATSNSDPNYYRLTSNITGATFSADMSQLSGLTLNQNGTVTGTPTFMGEKTVAVTVADPNNSGNTATLSLKVTSVSKLGFDSVPTGGIVATPSG